MPYEVSRTPTSFYALLADEGVTVLNQTPSAFRQLLPVDAAGRRSLSLRYVIFGGEALDFSQLAPWVERHGDESPQLVNMYGITETTVHVTYRRLRRGELAEPRGSLIGRPLGDLRLYVLDERGALVPIGVPGELHVGGAGLARGYLRQPALTAQRFVANRFGAGRLYRTGDRARWLASGELEYLGRVDQQLKLRGYRIEPGEIEAVLRERAGLADATVIARAHPSGESQLVAYALATDAAPAPDALRAQCRQWLPGYMIPAAFVYLDAWPLTPHGKLDRDALPAPELEPQVEQPFVAPRDEDEQKLCTIWEDVLNVRPVGIRHGFFELGGHSLLATQLVSRIRNAFGVELPLRALYEAPTVEQLSGAIAALGRQDPAASPQPLAPVRRSVGRIVVGADGELIQSDRPDHDEGIP